MDQSAIYHSSWKRKKKIQRRGPLVGVWKQISEQLFKRAHLGFDHRMRLENAFFWLHCISPTPLLMPNHISPLLKHRTFFCTKQLFWKVFSFPFSFSEALLSLSRMLSDTNSEGNVRPSTASNPVLLPHPLPTPSNAEDSSWANGEPLPNRVRDAIGYSGLPRKGE